MSQRAKSVLIARIVAGAALALVGVWLNVRGIRDDRWWLSLVGLLLMFSCARFIGEDIKTWKSSPDVRHEG